MLVKRATDFKIDIAARKDWETLNAKHTIDQVVDALFGLPDEQIGVARVRDRKDWRTGHGSAFGTPYLFGGSVNADGEWTSIGLLLPAWDFRREGSSDD